MTSLQPCSRRGGQTHDDRQSDNISHGKGVRVGPACRVWHFPRRHQVLLRATQPRAALAAVREEVEAKVKEIEDAVYDLKAVNPHKKPNVDTRTPEELMNIIEAKGKEVAEALAALRRN